MVLSKQGTKTENLQVHKGEDRQVVGREGRKSDDEGTGWNSKDEATSGVGKEGKNTFAVAYFTQRTANLAPCLVCKNRTICSHNDPTASSFPE